MWSELIPFRYRGYYYDKDTGLYYLQSRYYDPEVGRFINADDESIIVNSFGEHTDKNLYAYCDNNPITRYDECGDLWSLVAFGIGAVVGAAISAATSAISQKIETGSVNWRIVGANAISGAVSGALSTTAIGRVASTCVGAVLSGATYFAEQSIKGEKASLRDATANIAAGAVSGFIGGGGMNTKGLETTWKSANAAISRESRRANIKYARKQIAKFVAKKTFVKNEVKGAVASFFLDSIANEYVSWKLGY